MSIDRLFAALHARTPDAPVLHGDTQTWHAAALCVAVDELATRLADCRTVAVLADNGPDWVIADLAALRAGVVQVPLPPFFTPAQLAHVLAQSGADAVLTDQPERITPLGAGFHPGGKWNDLVLLQRRAVPAALPAGTAKISFTSGSTGSPKGACLSADGLIDTAAAVAARLADLPITRHLAVLPLALLLENSAGIYAPLLRGVEIHLPRLAALGWQGMAGFDPAALQRSVATLRPNSVILVPELLKAWTLYLAASGQGVPDSLVYAAVGGARVAPEALHRARALGLPAYQGYGLTECGSVVSLNRPGDDADDVGRPLDHVALRVEDGEIVVAARAFLGYLGTEAPHQDAAGERRDFTTGDLGRLDTNGHVHLSGRRKNLLITSFGRNVAPEWVEAALLAQPAVAQAVVSGEARPWLAAVLVAAPGAGPAQLADAVAHANAGLPDYARIGGWLAAEPFTPHNGQATGNGRPLRAAILNHHGAALAALYQESFPEEEPAHAVL
ncbi:MAG: AMP-binding protein [Rhodocyclales bacterium]|nr:AMP-binding protein [Rhodocyclales bacterium]